MFLKSPNGRVVMIHRDEIKEKINQGWVPATEADLNIKFNRVTDVVSREVKEEVEIKKEEIVVKDESGEVEVKKRGRKPKQIN